MAKLPAFQFYPGDWRKDMGVQSLDYFDRGVWWEMLCLMHESERRGVLVLNGAAMTDDMIARLLGLDKQTLTTSLTTLLSSNVASRDPETGAIMCRRMVRDEKLRAIRAEAGKMGGNPALLKQNGTTHLKPTANQTATPSSSSSSSVSTSLSKTKTPEGAKNAPSSSTTETRVHPTGATQGSKVTDPSGAVQALDHDAVANGPETPVLLFEEPTVTTRENSQLAAIREVFAYYVATIGRNAKTYTLSQLRRKKGLARLNEAVRMAHGNLAGAVGLMKAAIDEVALSDWHMGRDAKTEGKSYCDWEDHLFRSTEQFEKWLQRWQDASAKEAKHA